MNAFVPKRKPTKEVLEEYRAYECKLCGEIFEAKILNVLPGGKLVILSAYSQKVC